MTRIVSKERIESAKTAMEEISQERLALLYPIIEHKIYSLLCEL